MMLVCFSSFIFPSSSLIYITESFRNASKTIWCRGLFFFFYKAKSRRLRLCSVLLLPISQARIFTHIPCCLGFDIYGQVSKPNMIIG
ncbi:hypothetical protein M413DRAFT_133266 [Hebeloma cylindrosporum]|uniref:Uncharacterized protein n=1 Tax=Hebeloma cylindrosporum TaxID=76867 RepID=A0A0C3CDV7_HEBCY|nr:hypothetical protein M413DRAFT_133266 [Hebeloma cylindrosporum h7]